MKILVTGGNGQLGSELKALSTKKEYDFEFIDLDELDLSKSRQIENYLDQSNPDVIINCAAYTQVDQAEENIKLANALNHLAPKAIAAYCKKSSSRLIHISTDYVFDGQFNQPINESSKTNPLSVYGKTKLEGEKSVFKLSNDAYIIRTSWLYSNYGNNFVKTMEKLGALHEEISVVSDQIGTPTHARDLAKSILEIIKCLNTEKDLPGLYHFSNEGVCSWYDFAIEIFQQKGIKCKVNPISSADYPTKAHRPFYSVLDKSKFKSQFNLEINHWTVSLANYYNQ